MSITLGIAAVQVPNYLGGEPPPATRGHTVAGLITVVSVPPHPHGRNTPLLPQLFSSQTQTNKQLNIFWADTCSFAAL